MNKQSFLISVLEKLEYEWLPAGGLKMIAQEGKMTDEMIDLFIKVIESSMNDIKNAHIKEKLAHSVTALEHIKKLEEDSLKHDKEELDALEAMLNQL